MQSTSETIQNFQVNIKDKISVQNEEKKENISLNNSMIIQSEIDSDLNWKYSCQGYDNRLRGID